MKFFISGRTSFTPINLEIGSKSIKCQYLRVNSEKILNELKLIDDVWNRMKAWIIESMHKKESIDKLLSLVPNTEFRSTNTERGNIIIEVCPKVFVRYNQFKGVQGFLEFLTKVALMNSISNIQPLLRKVFEERD